jgi:hypothetical protein
VENGPETVTFKRLLPGTYAIYVNAYPPDESTPTFGSRVFVDVWLGDSEQVCMCVCMYMYIYIYIYIYMLMCV